ncbi:MAG: tRNA 5-methoxyuridine(34)/uridine 5-oxyacetic acid(34) synthase CmoB [Gammaproteobacteria bacterium]|nr:MAG: tRNA 5-methoxyuridine(34)/uridine 5-oxyacetic acid(34) synthase CmoB [Gammaproteobacteria bacterium]
MLDYTRLFADLETIDLASWERLLKPLLQERFAESAHGTLREWQNALQELPCIEDPVFSLDADKVTADAPALATKEQSRLRDLLLQLKPWRKGPFNLYGVDIDAEWRSDYKWQRLKDEIAPLGNRSVLDVGCGNGYYALRMLGCGARLVVGIEPTLLYVCQFLAIQRLLGVKSVHVIPLRIQELPGESRAFDTTFSMGVLYHQRDPLEHLQQLADTLRPGGELVMETLILPGSERNVRVPENRYARMRNIWHLPTVAALEDWLAQAGFCNIRTVDVSRTTVAEQRTTDWMTFESLAEALDPDDPTRTIEGWPAPTRAVVVCNTS